MPQKRRNDHVRETHRRVNNRRPANGTGRLEVTTTHTRRRPHSPRHRAGVTSANSPNSNRTESGACIPDVKKASILAHT